nr:hypothetical protein [Tanacetum cinerariifolium]
MIFDGMLRNLDNVSGKFLMYPRELVKDFLVRKHHSFQIQIGEGSAQSTDTQHTPIFNMPLSKPKKTQKPRQPKRKTTKVPQPSESTDIAADEAVHTERVTVCSGDGPMRQDTMRDTSAHTRVISSSDDEALDKKDTSKQGRIDEIDVDEDITLVITHDDELQDKGIEDVGEEEVVKERSNNSRSRGNNNNKNSFFTTTLGSGQRTKLMEESSKKDVTKTAQESSSKREGGKLEQKRSKKQKVEDDKKSKELKHCLEIISDDRDDVTIDATPLSSKSPTIVYYKIYKQGKKNYFQIFRADGNSQMYLIFSKLLKIFNREDLEVLWKLVKDRFKKVQPVDNMDSFLLHTLKTMFEHHAEDNVWKNQQGLTKVKN